MKQFAIILIILTRFELSIKMITGNLKLLLFSY